MLIERNSYVMTDRLVIKPNVSQKADTAIIFSLLTQVVTLFSPLILRGRYVGSDLSQNSKSTDFPEITFIPLIIGIRQRGQDTYQIKSQSRTRISHDNAQYNTRPMIPRWVRYSYYGHHFFIFNARCVDICWNCILDLAEKGYFRLNPLYCYDYDCNLCGWNWRRED